MYVVSLVERSPVCAQASKLAFDSPGRESDFFPLGKSSPPETLALNFRIRSPLFSSGEVEIKRNKIQEDEGSGGECRY